MSTAVSDAPVGADLLDGDLNAAAPSATTMDVETKQFAAKASEARRIPVSQIRKSDVALRGVQRQNEKYQLLLDSVKKRGVLQSLLVREQRDPESGQLYYGLVDGLQRYTAACDAGVYDVPANIVPLDDAEALEIQLITNLNRIETKPADVSKHLLRILSRNPFMTKQQLAERCSQSLTWVDQRLSIGDLRDEVKQLVNEGEIHLTNAYALSKIPEDEQMQHVEAAMTENPKTFVPRMKQRAKEIKDALKAGKDAAPAGFTPVQHLQKVSAFKDELSGGYQVGTALIKQYGLPDSAIEGWKLAMAWSLHFDQLSQEEQKRDFERKEAERKAEKERIKAQRETEKQQKAAQAKEAIDKGW
jgi:ParB/RepB/Spo0J family partition protein